MRALRDSRVGRAERMVQLLVDDGHPVSWQQVQDLAGGTVGRPHVGQALIDSGLVGSLDEAFGAGVDRHRAAATGAASTSSTWSRRSPW